MTPPQLSTERLTLRGFAEPDFEAFAGFYGSDRARFVGGPKRRDEAWRQFALELGHWQLRGYGNFAVVETATGRLAGFAGPWNPEGWPEPEIGWGLFEGFEGRGYATEAAGAARRWAFEAHGWPGAISLVDPANDGSARVAARLGARYETDLEHVLYGRLQVWRHPCAADLLKGAA